MKRFLLLFLALGFCVRANAQDQRSSNEQAQDLNARAVRAFHSGDMQTSESLLKQALGISSSLYETHFWLGRVYSRQAASNSTLRLAAIDAFSKALAIQPYGEQAALTQAWLFKVGGRPRQILVSALNSRTRDTFLAGDTFAYDSGESEQVAEQISQRPIEDYNVFAPEDSEFWRTLRDASQSNQTPTISKLLEAANDLYKHKTLPFDNLSKTAPVDESPVPGLGWIVIVAASDTTTTRTRHYRERKKRGGGKYKEEIDSTYSGQISGRLWIYDALSGKMLPTQTFSESSILCSSSESAASSARGSLVSHIQTRLKRLIAIRPDSRLLDEVLIPTPVSNVYARSSVAWEKAQTQPRLFFAACHPTRTEDADLTKTLADSLAFELLKQGRWSVISPGNAMNAFAGQSGRTVSSSAEIASLDVAQLCDVARQTGSGYALVVELPPVEMKEKWFVLFSRGKVKVNTKIRVYDVNNQSRIMEKAFTRDYKKDRLLSTNMTDSNLQFLPTALDDLTAEISSLIVPIAEMRLPTKTVAVPASQPEATKPPAYLLPE